MYFHVSAYYASLAAVTNSDVAAVADDVIQRRNSHLILSEPFNVIATYASGATLDRLRYANVALTIRGSQHFWPINQSATIPSRPALFDRRDMPLELPLNEEVTLEATTNAAGPAQTGAVLFLAKPQWTKNLPRGLDLLRTRATAVVAAGAEQAWGPLTALVMERDLYNGVYAVTGAHMVAANATAFRLFFPSQPQVEGRQLRPGGLVQNAIGDVPWTVQDGGLGEWGRFHTFEPPSVQVLNDAAGGTYELRLSLVYLGQDQGLLRSGL